MKLTGMIRLAFLIARTDLSRSPLNEGEDFKYSMVQDLHLLDRHALGIDNTLRSGAGRLWLQAGRGYEIYLLRIPVSTHYTVVWMLIMQPRTQSHLLPLFFNDKDTSAFVIPRIHRIVYVEALFPKAIFNVLRSSPYYKEIRVTHVPRIEVHDLVQYLEDPGRYQPYSWVKVKYQKEYRQDLALFSPKGTLLLTPRY